VVTNASMEQALYEAVLAALKDATDAQVRGVTVYVDSQQVVDQLRRQAPVPEDARELYVQVRCHANALWPTRFEVAKPTLGFAARQLAQDALRNGQTLTIAHGTPLLPLSFSEDLVA